MERRVDISFILHLCAILAPGLWLGRVLRIPPALHIGLTFLIFETSLVVGAGMLTWAGRLGQVHAYQLVTSLCSVGIAASLWWIAKSDSPTSSARPADQIVSGDDRKPIGRAWSAIPIACLAVFAVCMLVLALSAYPTVEDSADGQIAESGVLHPEQFLPSERSGRRSADVYVAGLPGARAAVLDSQWTDDACASGSGFRSLDRQRARGVSNLPECRGLACRILDGHGPGAADADAHRARLFRRRRHHRGDAVSAVADVLHQLAERPASSPRRACRRRARLVGGDEVPAPFLRPRDTADHRIGVLHL